jgi:hypothetical protein
VGVHGLILAEKAQALINLSSKPTQPLACGQRGWQALLNINAKRNKACQLSLGHVGNFMPLTMPST